MTRFRSLALLGLAGCASPTHLQYDFGRAYTDTLAIQSDLQRASAAGDAYPFGGIEGLELRQRVTEETTDAESGTAEYVDSFDVQ